MKRFLTTLRHIDRWMILAIATLSAASLVNLSGMPEFSILFVKQALFIVVGLALVGVIASTDYRFFRSSSLPGIIIWSGGIALLLAAIVTGERVRGAANWLFLGPISIGPIEIVKFGVLLVLAQFFAREHRRLIFPKQLFVSAIVVAVPAALVFLQPDLGSVGVLAAVWFFMVMLLGVPLRTVLAIIALVAISGAMLWGTALHEYQKVRIASFFSPERDPLGAGYQANQAMIAIGSSGIFGKGFFSEELSSRLAFLPESATDFAFASFTEKSGFAGAFILFLAFGLFLFRIERVAVRATNNFSCAYALGLFVLFATEAFLNIGMNLRILPVTGQPLPFVSYGGSHLLMAFLAVGLLESIRLHQPEFITKDREAVSAFHQEAS